MNTAMILAAGRGIRLKPITDAIPKALCVVNDKPLIEHHIINLSQAGVTRFIINHAHLGGLIRRYFGNGKKWGVDIIYSPEPPGGLETGGGIYNALPLIGKHPFLVVNADIYTDYDYRHIQLSETSQAHLVLVPKEPKLNQFGDFSLNDEKLVTTESREFTFSGIACYRPQLFQKLFPGRYSLYPLLKQSIEEGLVSGEPYYGFWIDIGSLKRLHAAKELIDIKKRIVSTSY